MIATTMMIVTMTTCGATKIDASRMAATLMVISATFASIRAIATVACGVIGTRAFAVSAFQFYHIIFAEEREREQKAERDLFLLL
jgi:hypothetical protein